MGIPVEVRLLKDEDTRLGIYLQHSGRDITVCDKDINGTRFLQIGDIIASVNGKRFRSAQHLAARIIESTRLDFVVIRSEYNAPLIN